MPENTLTNKELKAYMDNINEKLSELAGKFDKFCDKADETYVRKDNFDLYAKENDKRVTGNAKNIQKILWTTIGTLITALSTLTVLIINKWF